MTVVIVLVICESCRRLVRSWATWARLETKEKL